MYPFIRDRVITSKEIIDKWEVTLINKVSEDSCLTIFRTIKLATPNARYRTIQFKIIQHMI